MSPGFSRRSFVLGAMTAPLVARPAKAQVGAVSATDALGRTVTLPAPARRIVLAQGRQLNSLGFIHPDPVSILAGWGSDFARQIPDAYMRYKTRFPAIAHVPVVGDGATPGGFSLERTVALAPDLVLAPRGGANAGAGHGDLVARLEAAGVPVAVVDFFNQPLTDTVPSLRAIGRLTGQDERTERFVSFYEGRLRRVAGKIARARRPRVFMHVHAGGTECCSSPGRGTLNDFIQAAGGDNVASALLPGASGQISLEQLLVANPDCYVATGGRHLEKSGGLVLGLGVSRAVAEESFARLLATPGIAALGAVSGQRAFGLWHLFNDTPLHVAAIERLAGWLHPESCADLDPAATLAEAATFSAIPLDGALWVGPGRS
ncbi:iron ABC transporter substrate-binding protein [Camelimonas fluminis]|uniref:ABC transporter substrate-binding protein n=1 Tax=Camelimonas fluminis TaxID=1576911 RepID=A0ABV7UDC3_9HYPH|nr:ABC transporter substrate-binding protein [Camelimonas fluminis]GHE66114.1 iron ABC transporter substrate-binding protein [Camelimonas fluminis]